MGSVLVLCGCGRAPVASAPDELPKVPSTIAAPRDVDPEMQEAIDKAQKSLDTFLKRMANPARAETFSVEALFKAADDSPIYLWLGDPTYKDGVFTGVVTTNPNKATSIRRGDTVTAKRQDVTDWLILTSGKTEGGFTIDILLRREGQPR